MNDKQLFLPAILPDDATTATIEEIRQDFATRYNCRAALKPPVHITLLPPFSVTQEEADNAESFMAMSVTGTPAFEVQLRDYGAFTKNGVVYIDVVPSSELLDLQARIEQTFVTEFKDLIRAQPKYHPHITIGRKDIPAQLYPQALEEYRKKRFDCRFMCSSVVLLRHDGTNWKPHALYGLQ